MRGLLKHPPKLTLELRGFPPVLRLWKLPRRPLVSPFSASLVTPVLPTHPSTFPTQTRIFSATPCRIFGFVQEDGQDGVLALSLSPHHEPLPDQSAQIKELRRYDRGRGNLVGLSWLNLSPFSPVASENGGGVSDGGGGDGDGGMSGFKDKDDGG